jgi:hypothetical protein
VQGLWACGGVDGALVDGSGCTALLLLAAVRLGSCDFFRVRAEPLPGNAGECGVWSVCRVADVRRRAGWLADASGQHPRPGWPKPSAPVLQIVINSVAAPRRRPVPAAAGYSKITVVCGRADTLRRKPRYGPQAVKLLALALSTTSGI